MNAAAGSARWDRGRASSSRRVPSTTNTTYTWEPGRSWVRTPPSRRGWCPGSRCPPTRWCVSGAAASSAGVRTSSATGRLRSATTSKRALTSTSPIRTTRMRIRTNRSGASGPPKRRSASARAVGWGPTSSCCPGHRSASTWSWPPVPSCVVSSRTAVWSPGCRPGSSAAGSRAWVGSTRRTRSPRGHRGPRGHLSGSPLGADCRPPSVGAWSVRPATVSVACRPDFPTS